MKINYFSHCIKCGAKIPTTVVNQYGNKVSVSGRKYCFDCKPYGQGRQMKLEYDADKQDRKAICEQCDKEYIYHRKRSLLTTKLCPDCRPANSPDSNK